LLDRWQRPPFRGDDRERIRRARQAAEALFTPKRHVTEQSVLDSLPADDQSARKTRGYSAHSMRATFITTALENGAQLEDVQKAAGHRDPGTTKLYYDRRGYNPKKAASFFATTDEYGPGVTVKL
jgi:site-specific recombinase XerD